MDCAQKLKKQWRAAGRDPGGAGLNFFAHRSSIFFNPK